jgi:hypothetical protein
MPKPATFVPIVESEPTKVNTFYLSENIEVEIEEQAVEE